MEAGSSAFLFLFTSAVVYCIFCNKHSYCMQEHGLIITYDNLPVKMRLKIFLVPSIREINSQEILK